MRLTLIKRIMLIAFIPCCAYAMSIAYQIFRNLNEITNKNDIIFKLNGIKVISQLIKSEENLFESIYAAESQTVIEQFKKKRRGYIVDVSNYFEYSEYINNLDEILSNIPDSNNFEIISPLKLSENYSIVDQLINFQVFNRELEGTNNSNIIQLERTRKALSLLYSSTLFIVREDIPINKKTFDLIINLKGIIDFSLNNNNFKYSNDTQKKVDHFNSSSSWERINNEFRNVLKYSSEGGFGVELKNITDLFLDSKNNLDLIVNSEINSIIKNEERAKNELLSSMIFTAIMITFLLLSIVLLVYYLVRLTKNELQEKIKKLDLLSEDVAHLSKSIDSNGKFINESSVSQAGSIQETAASTQEISETVKNNAEQANNSLNKTMIMREIVTENALIMAKMEDSMSEIMKSNDEIKNLVTIIGDIGNKTAVIDEIVLQTKLLSFNASVEAERAGEHGRGFAVVAKEIASLAKNSGVESAEISKIVKNSVKKSESITSVNQKKVELTSKILIDAKNKLDLLKNETEQVSSYAKKISTSSKEQSSGVEHINTAMSELDQNNRESLNYINKNNELTVELQKKSKELLMVSTDISSFVGINTKSFQISPNLPHGDDDNVLNFKKLNPNEHTQKKYTTKKIANNDDGWEEV